VRSTPGEGRAAQGFPNPRQIVLRAICPLPQGARERKPVLATLPPPSPRARGEGWGEGALTLPELCNRRSTIKTLPVSSESRRGPLNPSFSPRAGRRRSERPRREPVTRTLSFSQRMRSRVLLPGSGRCETIVRSLPLTACFFSSLSKRRREAERRQTLIRILRISYDAARAFWARLSDGVPPRLSPKGVFHPKGSASGQASWDAV
jgi:hypothetical protein